MLALLFSVRCSVRIIMIGAIRGVSSVGSITAIRIMTMISIASSVSSGVVSIIWQC